MWDVVLGSGDESLGRVKQDDKHQGELSGSLLWATEMDPTRTSQSTESLPKLSTQGPTERSASAQTPMVHLPRAVPGRINPAIAPHHSCAKLAPPGFPRYGVREANGQKTKGVTLPCRHCGHKVSQNSFAPGISSEAKI